MGVLSQLGTLDPKAEQTRVRNLTLCSSVLTRVAYYIACSVKRSMPRRHAKMGLFSAAALWLTLGLTLGAVDQTAAMGFVGCLYSEKLCDPEEFCFNDQAYGKCVPLRGATDEDLYQHDTADPVILERIESERERLAKYNYDWQDGYTQCV